jgi:hypothetical protein
VTWPYECVCRDEDGSDGHKRQQPSAYLPPNSKAAKNEHGQYLSGKQYKEWDGLEIADEEEVD